MRIEKLEIRGFGKLSGFKFSFQPQISVIWGPNEAGKSTLLEFLYRMFFGFDLDDPSGEEGRERDRWRPWSGGSYGGRVRLLLANRRRLEIERDFEEGTFVVNEVTSRESRFAEVDGREGEAGFDPEDLLGMAANVYRTTAMLLPGRAADVLEHRDALREALARASAGAGGSPEADKAAARITERADQQVGIRESRFTPLASKRARLASLRQELATIKKKRNDLDRTRREIAQTEDRVTGGRKRGKVGKKLARLRARAGNLMAGERERSVVEEEIRVCQQDLDKLEETRAATLMATRALQDVSRSEYRGFASDLEDELRGAIKRVTVGRYHGGSVDPEDLTLRVNAPGAPGPVPAGHFSQGTRIQLFGVFRFAISRYFGRVYEPAPFLLDEPYAECDPDRLAASCAYLLDLAKQHQIVLVTHNRRILELTGVADAEVRRVVVKDRAGSRRLRAVARR